MKAGEPTEPFLHNSLLADIGRRLDLRQRASARISGPFIAQGLAAAVARLVPIRFLHRLETSLLFLARRSDFFADFLDCLLESLMLLGQRRNVATAGDLDGLVALAFHGRKSRPGVAFRSSDKGGSLVIVLPGADWRRGLDEGWSPENRHWLFLSKSASPPGPQHGSMVEVGLLRGLPADSSGMDLRRAAGQAIKSAAEFLPGLADAILANAVGLENQLTNEIDRFHQQATDAALAFKSLQPTAVTILEGYHDGGAIVAAVVEAGCNPAAITMVRASARLSCRIRSTVPLASHSAELLQQRAQLYCRQAWRPRFSKGFVVLPATNPRHLPRAVDAMAELAKSARVDLLFPTANIELPLIRAAFSLFLANPFRVRSRFIQSHQFFRPQRGRHAAPSEALRGRFIPTALASRSTAEAVRLGVAVFADHFLLQSLAIGDRLEEAFRRSRPKALVLVPGTTSVAQVAAASARKAGVPSWQVQTLLTQADGREFLPVADHVGVIDTCQRDLFRDYFRVPENALYLTGYITAGNAVIRSRSSSVSGKSPTRKRLIVFVSQPLYEPVIRSLSIIAEALALNPSLECEIRSHPMESARQIAALQAIAAQVPGGRLRWMGKGTPDDAIVNASVVACLFSNVGIHAAMVGRDVVVIEPPETRYPVDFAQMGIAIKVQDSDRLVEVMDDILNSGTETSRLWTTRADYFALNEHLLAGNTAARFARLLTLSVV